METQYTPTQSPGPWKIGKDHFVYDATGHFVCVSGFHHTVAGGSHIPARLNTAFIVRACNAHDQLVAVAKLAQSLTESALSEHGRNPKLVAEANLALSRINAALAAAGAA